MKSSMSIGWHKECLKNNDASLERKLEELSILRRQIEESESRNKHYRLQIEAAIRKNKTSFDRERFFY